MFTVTYDPLRGSYENLVLRVEASRYFEKAVDSSWVAGFLHEDLTAETTPEEIRAFLNYLALKFTDAPTGAFIPFGLFEECVEGFLITNVADELLTVSYSRTVQLTGYEVAPSNLESLMLERAPAFKEEANWVIPRTSVLDGLQSSIQQLSTTT